MADKCIRQQELRWKESGSVEDEAAYMFKRLKAGALTREQLKFAVHLGNEAARAVVAPDEPEPQEVDTLQGLCVWLGGMEKYGGREALLRVVLMLGNLILEVLQPRIIETNYFRGMHEWNDLSRVVDRLRKAMIANSITYQSDTDNEMIERDLGFGFYFLMHQILQVAFYCLEGIEIGTMSNLNFAEYELRLFLSDQRSFIGKKHPMDPRIEEIYDRESPEIVRPLRKRISACLLPWVWGVEDPLLSTGLDDEGYKRMIVVGSEEEERNYEEDEENRRIMRARVEELERENEDDEETRDFPSPYNEGSRRIISVGGNNSERRNEDDEETRRFVIDRNEVVREEVTEVIEEE